MVRKRKLKKWVRVVLWCIALSLVSWLFHWTITSLQKYWRENAEDSAQNEDRAASSTPDNEMVDRLESLMHQYTRLDTSNIAIGVYDLTARQYIFQWHNCELMPPASCIKLMTAIAGMKRLGVNHELRSRTLITGNIKNGVLHGDAIIQAEDDPMQESLAPFISSIRDAGIRQIDGLLVLNLARTDTLRAHHTASSWDIPYNRIPVLLKGSLFIEREARFLMRQYGIAFQNLVVKQGCNSFAGARPIKTLRTNITDIIAPMLIHSSNIKADALFWHIGHHGDRFSSLTGNREDHINVFLREDLKFDTCGFSINDGSGLSPQNRVDADFLIALLRYAWEENEIRTVLLDKALAIPGHHSRNGSLMGRMSSQVFRGRIFCKTGTLTSHAVSSLSGYAKARNGHWYAFAIINRDSPVAESRNFQDLLCKELVR